MPITILTEAELRQCFELNLEIIDAIADAFAALAAGRVVMPPILHMDLPEAHGEVDVKTAYVSGLPSFVDDIEEATEDNEDFRRVLHTGTPLQLVLMALPPGESIGETKHEDRDQFFCIEAGEGEIVIDGSRHPIEDDFAALVPAGARYDVINTGDEPLKLYALYAPPDRRDDVGPRREGQAEADAEHSDDETPE